MKKKIIEVDKIKNINSININEGEDIEQISFIRNSNELELKSKFFIFNVISIENGFKYNIFDRINSLMYSIENTKENVIFSKYYTNEEDEYISDMYVYHKNYGKYNEYLQINWDIDNYDIYINNRNISVSKDNTLLFIIKNNQIIYFYNKLSEINIKYDKYNNIHDAIFKNCIKNESILLKFKY